MPIIPLLPILVSVALCLGTGLRAVCGQARPAASKATAAPAGIGADEERALRDLVVIARDPERATEARRAALAALTERVAALRTNDFEPLADVDTWARILADKPRGGPVAVPSSGIVSRPFEGYHFALPRDYDAARAYPLVICLHATGESGLAHIERYWRRPDAPKVIVFAPDWPDESRVRWAASSRLDRTLGIVGDVILDRFNVDRNKIFVDGAGDGGSEAWRLASYVAPLLAGLIVRGGLPADAETETPIEFTNLRHVRTLYFYDDKIHGERFAGWTALREELDNIGKGLDDSFVRVGAALDEEASPAAMAKRIAPFVGATVRDPFPVPITWRVHDNNTRRAYWIRSIDEEYALHGRPASFDAYVDRARNVIEIGSSRIRGLEIQLNDRIVDLSRRLRITVNGKVAFDGMPSRSVARLLRAAQRSGDPHDVFPWGTRIEIDGRR